MYKKLSDELLARHIALRNAFISMERRMIDGEDAPTGDDYNNLAEEVRHAVRSLATAPPVTGCVKRTTDSLVELFEGIGKFLQLGGVLVHLGRNDDAGTITYAFDIEKSAAPMLLVGDEEWVADRGVEEFTFYGTAPDKPGMVSRQSYGDDANDAAQRLALVDAEFKPQLAFHNHPKGGLKPAHFKAN